MMAQTPQCATTPPPTPLTADPPPLTAEPLAPPRGAPQEFLAGGAPPPAAPVEPPAGAPPSLEQCILRVLSDAADPKQVREIVAALKSTELFPQLRKCDVNPLLYKMPACETVPGSKPPRWFVPSNPFNELVGFLDPKEAPPAGSPGAFNGRVAIVGCDTNQAAVAEVVKTWAGLKYALYCFGGAGVGGGVLRAAAEIAHAAEPIEYTDGTRKMVSAANRAAMLQADSLCVIAPRTTDCYRVHSAVAAYEAAGRPVYHRCTTA
jgi:hypothetical protein